ncbi:LppP/LprE family lipoprotein [Alicyclobacillus curvatus]|nr:LppP/LprE family lipoprotein [Alicyclobacillus curvatus]
MNKHFAIIPITGFALLTLAGCGTTTNGAGAGNAPVTNSTASTASTAGTAGTNGVSPSVANTNNATSHAGTATNNNVEVSVSSTPTVQATDAREIALVKQHGYSVSGTTPSAIVRTASGDTLVAWIATATQSQDGHNQLVFFFLNGKYLGTDTAKPSLMISNAKAVDSGISVTYPVYRKGDSFADPTGTPVTIVYTWNGSKLVPNQPYPHQFQTGRTSSQFGTTNQPLNSVSMTDSNSGWATGQGSVWLTTDGGVQWNNVTPNALSKSKQLEIKVFGLTATQAWVAVTNDSSVDNPVSIFHTSNGGESWNKQQFSDVGNPITLHFSDSSNGWLALMQGAAAGSEGETLYNTHNGGTTWSKVGVANYNRGSLPFGGDKTGASFLNHNHGWATGFTPVNGRIYLYQTTDAGGTWNLQSVPVPSSWKNAELTSYPPVFFSQQDGILPVSSGSTLLMYRTTNGGQSWLFGKPVQSAAENEAIQAWSFPSFNDGFAADGNLLLKTKNGGQTWSAFTPNISLQNVSQLQFTSSEDGWALMNSQVLYHTSDGGHTWMRE